METFRKDALTALTKLREMRPVTHCITNYVTAGDTANMLLAVGASPIMADDPADAAEVSAGADAVMLNMGTLSESHIEAIIKAGKSANECGIPVVFDPVGVHLTEFRREAALKILSEVKVSIIRGNLSEMLFMGGIPVRSHGVDSSDKENEELKFTASREVAGKYGCICAVTGEKDIITDGNSAVRLQNGTTLLRKITGAGDMTSAVTAAFSATAKPFKAAVFGTAFMGICGEIAEKLSENKGMGTFRAELFNAAGINAEMFSEKIKIEVLEV